jgi:SAM-dependent methyltransferase
MLTGAEGRAGLVAGWQAEEQQPFVGWDFAHLAGRMLEDQPPWSYTTRAAELMQGARTLLDMGTGGGERLLKLRAHWPPIVMVTEDYPPNVKLATGRLGPLGVRVVDVPLGLHHRLPFVDGGFDLVINRHSAFSHAEVARVLAPGGVFFTQQVHGLWAQDLVAVFDARPQWPDSTLERDVAQLEEVGLAIRTARNWSGRLAFADVGAIVYYLRAVPWLVPGFSVATHLAALLRLQDRLEGGGLAFEARMFLIEARHP